MMHYYIINILTHADDALLFASTRNLAISKLKRLANYCKRNSITIEPSKSNFIVINGTDDDHRNLPLGDNLIDHEEYLLSLGSHLSEKGDVARGPEASSDKTISILYQVLQLCSIEYACTTSYQVKCSEVTCYE